MPTTKAKLNATLPTPIIDATDFDRRPYPKPLMTKPSKGNNGTSQTSSANTNEVVFVRGKCNKNESVVISRLSLQNVNNAECFAHH